jgi:transposase-like protein
MNQKKMKSDDELKNLLEIIRNNINIKCPVCSSKGNTLKSETDRVVCSFKLCKKRFNIWSNTIFSFTKQSKILVLKVLDLWMEGLKIKHISYVTGVGRTTIWRILSVVSKLIEKNNKNLLKKIGGKDIIVEVDESKFGKRKYHRGHRVEGVWILGMVERTEARRVILLAVDARDAETLKLKLVKHVNEDSTIYSDRWRGYNKLCKNFAQHLTVNHSKNFKDPETDVHTNTIEGTWAGVKLTIPNKNRTKEKRRLICIWQGL